MDYRKVHREKFWREHNKTEYTCPECGRGFGEVSEFQVHHIDGDVQNGDMDNLVGLCKQCHHDQHGDWIDDYTFKGQYRRRKRFVGSQS